MRDMGAALANISQDQLDNGLRLVMAPDAGAPVVAVNLWYAVGSRDEPPGSTGFAHLFEHMMFQGSAHVPKNGHFEHLERVGGSANATTWFDRTNYFQTLPSHHLDLALWLESDRMGWMLPALTEEKLQNQRNVVLNERRERYENQPYGNWDERLQALLFAPEHPYHHTVIGAAEDIEAATLDDVRAFFRAFYVPDNAVLTLCGDFAPEDARAGVRRYFGAIPPGQSRSPAQGKAEAGFSTGETMRVEVRARVPLPRVYMAAKVPPFTSEEFYAGQVASACLGAGRCSRLHDRLVRGARIAKSAVCHLLPLTAGATMLVVVVTGLPGTTAAELEEAAGRELDDAASLDDGEVARSVTGMETRALRSLQAVGERADLLSMYATCFGDAGRAREDLAWLRQVGTDDVQAWAKTYLHEANRAVVRYEPAGAA